MYINPKKCVACGNCTYVCPMGAIYIDPVIKRATVNLTECVECYACYNGPSQEHTHPSITLPPLTPPASSGSSACYNGLSQEHLNPTMVRTMRKIFQWLRLRFD